MCGTTSTCYGMPSCYALDKVMEAVATLEEELPALESEAAVRTVDELLAISE